MYHPICIPNNGEFIFLKPLSVVTIEAAGKYCDINFVDGKKLKSVSISITELEELLPRSIFFRVHKSYIVSVAHIEWMNREKTRVYSCCGLYVKVSPNYLKNFLDGLSSACIGKP